VCVCLVVGHGLQATVAAAVVVAMTNATHALTHAPTPDHHHQVRYSSTVNQ